MRKDIFRMVQVGGKRLDLYYINQLVRMGSINSRQYDVQTEQQILELTNLCLNDYSHPYQLSFNPKNTFANTDISQSHLVQSLTDDQDLDEEETQVLHPQIDCTHTENQMRSNEIRSSISKKQDLSLQKNQSRNSKIKIKRQTIQKNTYKKVSKKEPNTEIRDQNNCKTYHKLVKNHLQKLSLSHLIEPYESKYHTRYYFTICLMIIDLFGKDQDFPATYKKIVEEQLQEQRDRILKKTALRDELIARKSIMRQGDIGWQQLQMKLVRLNQQMMHLQVVMHQICDYSLRSCEAYFKGNLRESLEILYRKDDKTMKKSYYFRQALSTVQIIFDALKSLSSF